MASLVMPHDSWSSHFYPNGETDDTELEKNNFKKAGNISCQIWEELVLDGKPVTAKYAENELIETIGYNNHGCSNNVLIWDC